MHCGAFCRRAVRQNTPRGSKGLLRGGLVAGGERVLRTAEHPAPFEGNTGQVLDSAIVQEINYPLSKACYAAETAAITSYGGACPAAELEVIPSSKSVESMETVLIKTVADELGIVKEYALRLAKKHGFEIHYGRRNVASLLKADAERLVQDYEPRRTTNGTAPENTEFDGFGYFYLIQLLPDEMPDRIKIGYTDSMEQRLADHRVTNPTLKLLKSWPCKRTWERAVTASVTREGCLHVGGEVYQGDVQGFLHRAEAFFALLPTVERV